MRQLSMEVAVDVWRTTLDNGLTKELTLEVSKLWLSQIAARSATGHAYLAVRHQAR